MTGAEERSSEQDPKGEHVHGDAEWHNYSNATEKGHENPEQMCKCVKVFTKSLIKFKKIYLVSI